MSGARIQLKRSTAASWTSNNPVLFVGEIGYETDTKKFKIGDGSTAWTSLTYSSIPLNLASINDLGDVTITAAADGDFLRWNGTAWVNDAVNLSTDTIGSYVESLVAGTGVTLSDNSGEGATPTVAIGQDVSTSATVEFGALTVNGQTTIGGHVLPDENETFDLGSASYRFRDIYLSGTTIDLGGAQITSDGTAIAFSGEISVGGGANLVGDVTGNADTATTLQTARNIAGQSFDGSANISIAPTDLTGVTSTAAEINILDGATLSTTELNYVDGVTSAIQTQIDTKAPLASPTFTGTVTVPAPSNNTDAVTKAYVDTTASTTASNASTALTDHEADTTNIHGIADTSILVTTTGTQTLTNKTITAPSGLVKSDVGLGSVDNTSDANKPVSTAQQTALDLKAPLDSPTLTGTPTLPTGTIATTQTAGDNSTAVATTAFVSTAVSNLVDTAPEALNTLNELAAALGDDENFATTTATNLGLKAPIASPTFTGTVTVPAPSNDTDASTKAYVDSTASTTAGNAATALSNHEADTTNVHGIADTSILVTTTGTQTLTNKTITSPAGLVKGDVGLGNVDNTSDANKPVSTATQTALDLKADLASPTFTGTVTIPTGASITAPTGLVKGDVGLGNADNTSDANKPVSTATQTALDLKAPLASPTFTGTVTIPTGASITSPTGLVKGDVGLGNVDNTADANKPVSTAQQTALDLKADLASPTFTGTVAGITSTMVGLGNVDNTSDANKPVSTATQTALDLKAPLASPTFTGTVTIPTGASITAPTGLVKGDVGLGNVDNTSDVNKPVSTDTQTALDLKANLASPTFTGTPTLPTGTIAVTQTAGDNTTAVATTAYVETAVSNLVDTAPAALNTLNELAAALGDDENFATTTATNLGLKAPLASPTFTGTVTIPTGASITAPTGLVKGDVGLGNVDNTSDANKPVSTAAQTALDLKAPLASPTFTGTVTIPTGASITAPTGLVKDDVGLGNVDNTSDANKPVSTAQQTALDLKADLASPTFTGTVSGITSTMVGLGNVDNTSNATERAATATLTNKTLTSPVINTPTGIVKGDVGLGNVDNTSDANKPVSTATQTALDLKAPLASPTFTGTVAGITATMVGLGNVDDTSDANKPVSTAQQTALDLKAPLASPTFTGTVTLPSGTVASADLTWSYYNTEGDLPSASTKHGMFAHVHGTGAAYYAHAGAWYKLAKQTDLDLAAPLASPTFTGTVTVPTPANDTDAATKLYVDSTVAGASISSLDDIGDVTITTAANGDYLKWNGTAFVNDDIDLGTDTVGDYVATITGGTGVTSSAATTGEGTTHTLSIGQAVGTSDNVTFNDVNVSGNLTVSGTTTSVNTETLTVDDNIVVLNNNVTGAPTENAGIEVERGSSTNVQLRWNETSDKWELTADGAAYADIATETYADGVVTEANIITAIGADGTSGQVLKTDGSGDLSFGDLSLDDISDVNITTASSGQFLKWNGTAWVNDSIPTINTLDDVGDVTITSAASGEFLKWNGTAWVNDAIDLGTDTTGNYMADVSAGDGITVTHSAGEGSTATISARDTLVRFYMEVI